MSPYISNLSYDLIKDKTEEILKINDDKYIEINVNNFEIKKQEKKVICHLIVNQIVKNKKITIEVLQQLTIEVLQQLNFLIKNTVKIEIESESKTSKISKKSKSKKDELLNENDILIIFVKVCLNVCKEMAVPIELELKFLDTVLNGILTVDICNEIINDPYFKSLDKKNKIFCWKNKKY